MGGGGDGSCSLQGRWLYCISVGYCQNTSLPSSIQTEVRQSFQDRAERADRLTLKTKAEPRPRAPGLIDCQEPARARNEGHFLALQWQERQQRTTARSPATSHKSPYTTNNFEPSGLQLTRPQHARPDSTAHPHPISGASDVGAISDTWQQSRRPNR